MTKIGVSKKETTIETPFSPAMFAIARGLPAQFRWDGKTLIVRTVRANLDYLREVFPDAEWIDEDGALAEINGVADIKKTSPTDTGDYVFGTEPFDYQRDCFLVSRARRSFSALTASASCIRAKSERSSAPSIRLSYRHMPASTGANSQSSPPGMFTQSPESSPSLKRRGFRRKNQ